MPCEEQYGCIQCNGDYWLAIEKTLKPLLVNCSNSLKDKNTVVEFHGSLPCTIDDLYMTVSYDLKPRKNLSFVVVQPRSDNKIWEDAWTNLSDDCHNNFGGLFEHVCCLNYILYITVCKMDKLWSSSYGPEKQKDTEETSGYFQENTKCKSNPLEMLSKRKSRIKKRFKYHQIISSKTVNATSNEYANDLVMTMDSSLSANKDMVKTSLEIEDQNELPFSQHNYIKEEPMCNMEIELPSLGDDERNENQSQLTLSPHQHASEEMAHRGSTEVVLSSLDDDRKQKTQERLLVSPHKCISEELVCNDDKLPSLDEENQNILPLSQYKHLRKEQIHNDDTETELQSLAANKRLENWSRLPVPRHKHKSEKLLLKKTEIELTSLSEEGKLESQNKLLNSHKHLSGEVLHKRNNGFELQSLGDEKAENQTLCLSETEEKDEHSLPLSQYKYVNTELLCNNNTDVDLPSLDEDEEKQNQTRLPYSKHKCISKPLMYKDDAELEISSKRVGEQDNVSRALRKKVTSMLTLVDFSSSDDEYQSNHVKNLHRNKKHRSSKLKRSNVKSSQSQLSALKTSEVKRNYTSKISSAKRKKTEKTFGTIKYSPESEKKAKELNGTAACLHIPLPSSNKLKCENGKCTDNSIISLPKLDVCFTECNSKETLCQRNVNNKVTDAPKVKRTFSPGSSQRTMKKASSFDKPVEHSAANNEHTVANSFEKRKNNDQISRLRNLFLDIVSGKKNNDIMKSIDVDYLNADFSPIDTKTTGHINATDVDDDERNKNVCLVRSLTKPQLNRMFSKHLSKLKDIYRGKIYCKRHEDYLRGGKTSHELIHQINLSPFKEEQLDYIMELLMSEFLLKPKKDVDYLLKVLLPEALIMIFMEYHGTDYENSDRLMAEAAFNEGNIESV